MALCGGLQGNALVVTVIALVGRFFITFAMNAGQQMSFELFPTELRAQGSSLTRVVSQLVIFGSPYVVYSSVWHPGAPFYILAVLGLINALVALALPEAAGVDLPNTMEEAENFGKNQNFFYMPILNNLRKD